MGGADTKMPNRYHYVNTKTGFGIDASLVLAAAAPPRILVAEHWKAVMAKTASLRRGRNRQVKLLPLGPHARFNEAYAALAVAMSQAGLAPEDLSRAQIHTFWDLREPYHEHAIGGLHHWWNYDQARLMGRSRRSGADNPRILLKAFISRPGNLAVEWEPQRVGGSDWSEFHRLSAYGPYRPSNELMFIRGVKRLNPAVDGRDLQQNRRIDAHLLACIGAAIECLETRLAICFDIRWESSFQLDWAPQPKDRWIPKEGLELLGWHIEDVVARTQRQERDELAALLELTQRDAAGFIQLLTEIEPELKLDHLRDEASLVRVQKRLRQHEINMTPALLGRMVQLLEGHHAELLRPLWRAVGGGLKVVK
ncbi:hypothetical protein [Roseococcus sp. YIM B11640]|uniref:hypothetical protein n=1 Tax=Roseococcus sp. YIM B11640 TaxID=3133973 RepID=UPI003C7A3FE3